MISNLSCIGAVAVLVLFMLFLSEAMDVDDSRVHVSHVDYLAQRRNASLVVAVVLVFQLSENRFNTQSSHVIL